MGVAKLWPPSICNNIIFKNKSSQVLSDLIDKAWKHRGLTCPGGAKSTAYHNWNKTSRYWQVQRIKGRERGVEEVFNSFLNVS